jgi:uncharacterized membrane protein YgcG
MAAILCMGLSAGVQAASLTVEDGVTIKFGSGAGITVHDALHTGQGVTLTSLNDSTVGGTAAVNLPPATAGDWRGLTVTRKVDPADLVIDNIVLRYAGGNAAGGNGAALSIKNRAYHFNALTINNSVTALRVDGFDSGPNPGSPTLTGTTLTANQIGMVVDNNAAPSITQSNIYSNTSYGVLNNTPATVVDATQNWWGHASGPKDPINNPSGSGNAVSTGVDYGQFTANRVLAGCTILPANGSYVTTVREVTFNLYCPLANQVRLGETANITSSYVALTAQRAFTLSSTVGEKQVYAQFRASSDGAVTTVALPQPMVYNPAPFSVTITAPPANATLTENTTISAVVISALSITKVEFFIDGVSIGTVTAPPYNRVWNIASATAGTHTIKVVATDSDSQTAEATRTVTVQKGPIDTEGPALTPTFAGQALVNGATITTTGTLALSATDPSGVKRLEMKLDGVSLAQTQPAGSPTTASYSTPVTFDGIANGAHTLSFIGEDTLGNLTTLDIGFTLTLSAPPAPTITSPASGANVSQPNVAVSGQAAIGSQVQLYLNGAATGGLINADSSGRFSGSVVLPGEGSHTLQADARNSRGTSARSAAVNVTYTMAAPTVSFVSPAANIVLSASVEIAVLTTDPGGTIQSIVLSANGTTLTTLTSGETSFLWDIADVADGAYTLKAVATSSSGKTAEATRNVTVKHIIPEVLTPYTGEVLQALPAVSYGWDAVTISGRAKDRATNESVANIALRLVLQVGSFQRKINVVTDEAGNFTFRFDPQATDAGTYQLAALHPDETKFVEQARFTINRLSTNISTYSLNAARTIAYNIPISVAASAGTGSHGVRWEARAEDQPSGSVPPGISINGGSGVDVPASRSVPVNIAFNGNTPLETGTIIFTLVASDTGNVARAKLTLNWRLSDPQPALAPSPTYIQTGTQQNIPVSATVTLTNKGLAAAHNVRVQLQTSAGGLNLPDWISLGSSENLGTLEVGDKQILQVNVAPGTAVSDGFYYFRIWVSADNAAGGQIPITVAVSQAGEAGVRFEVSDLYTNTLDDKGQVILGVNNALITVQNEVVTNIQRSVRSNAQGIAEIQGLPPGTYRYNASATNRISTSGRFQMLAGITIPQPVFLDYQPINVEFRVNETTIRDVYEITINATYQTQVPAPVVVLTPTAINLPSMQVGEEITGELTLSNNGLVRADNLVFTPPKSDEYYHYEFKTDSIPSQLEAKTRITIPYKVTAKQAAMGKAAIAEGSRVMLKAQADGSIEKQTMEQKSGTCHSYSAGASAKCEYECANGQWSKSCGSSSGFYRTIGSNCGSGGGSSGGGGGGGGGWGGGGGGYTPGPVPMTPKCDPECEKGECC